MGKINKELLVKLLAELLASLFVEFVGCTVTTLSTSSLTYAVGWGGAVIAATQAFRIISGAHINPCISIAAMIMQNVEIVDGLLYILMQLLGSAMGYGIGYGLTRVTDKTTLKYCVTAVTIKPWWKSIIIEFYMTCAWVFAMCASWNVANENMLETISLRIGIVVAACCLAGGGHTGASMNPFRSLWPAIAASFWDYIYIYMAVPPITAALIACVGRFVFVERKEE